MDVLVVGPYFCDIVYTGLDHLPLVGEEVWAADCTVVPGGAYVTALALHRLGVSSAWVTTFGSDPFSAFVRNCAEAEGMSSAAYTTVASAAPQVSTSLSLGYERSFVSYASSDFAFPQEGAVEQILRLQPRVVILPGTRPHRDEVILSAARRVGAATFVDPQAEADHLNAEALQEFLTEVDIFALNEREAAAICGDADPLRSAELLAQGAPLILLKRGPSGALAIDRQGRLNLPAVPVQALDTTGAGDCFNAGFVMGWLRGDPIRRCLELANAAGALSTQAPSSLGAPTLAAVEEALQSLGDGRPDELVR